MDGRVALFGVGGEAVAGVVEGAGNGALFDFDGVFAKVIVAFAGHQGSVGDDFGGKGRRPSELEIDRVFLSEIGGFIEKYAPKKKSRNVANLFS